MARLVEFSLLAAGMPTVLLEMVALQWNTTTSTRIHTGVIQALKLYERDMANLFSFISLVLCCKSSKVTEIFPYTRTAACTHYTVTASSVCFRPQNSILLTSVLLTFRLGAIKIAPQFW